MATDHPTSESALAAFVSRKDEFDTLLLRLHRLSGDFFGVGPDDVNWGHVTELADYCRKLREVTDQAYREGEYAE
jgi:hypothetical protein